MSAAGSVTPRDRCYWLQFFGWCLGGISIFSLIKRYMQLPVIKLVSDILEFYRAIADPIGRMVNSGIAWALGCIGLSLPAIPADIMVIYLLGAGALWRGYAVPRLADGAKYRARKVRRELGCIWRRTDENQQQRVEHARLRLREAHAEVDEEHNAFQSPNADWG
jgi:hypothetical protein